MRSPLDDFSGWSVLVDCGGEQCPSSVRNNGAELLEEAVDVAPLTQAGAAVDVNPAGIQG